MDNNKSEIPKINIIGPNGPFSFGEEDLTPEERILLPIFRKYLAEKIQNDKIQNNKNFKTNEKQN